MGGKCGVADNEITNVRGESSAWYWPLDLRVNLSGEEARWYVLVEKLAVADTGWRGPERVIFVNEAFSFVLCELYADPCMLGGGWMRP